MNVKRKKRLSAIQRLVPTSQLRTGVMIKRARADVRLRPASIAVTMTWAYALCELAGDWGQGDRIMVKRSLGCIRSYSFEVGPKWGPTITIFWGLLLVTVFKATRCLIGLR
ncbi:hypothetical protein QUC31_004671 [Theobroma cacao]